ncbi:MAG TPA: hypothetical protein VKB95_05180 [Chitinophagaceae bacterium]|nr:hypothetical protein [Chitinophagaceae bacterium]
MKPSILKAILVFALFSITCFIHGQGKQTPNSVDTPVSAKPFKVLTNGKQITIQSKQNLRSLMVWTASGHRFVEEKELKTNSYSFTVPSKEKIFFMMIETAEGKRFTEKMGVK